MTATRTNPRALPVRTPTTKVRPPRTNGLSTARVSMRSACSAGDVGMGFTGGSGARGGGTPGGGQRGLVVGEVGDLLHILGVAHLIKAIKHKNSPAFDSQLFNQGSVIRAERTVFVVGEHLDLVNAEGTAPALLREGQV